MRNELENRIKQLSDEELLNMLDRNPEDYSKEVLCAAEAEAHKRGGKDKLYEIIEYEFKSQQHTPGQVVAESSVELEVESLPQASECKKSLSDETVLNVSYSMIRGASGHSQELIDSIQHKLSESNMPCPTKWGLAEIQTKGLLSRVKRDFLVVSHDAFPDYNHYISVRDFGIYLDCIRIFTIEPGFLKKFLSKRMNGDPGALSTPRNVLKLHDLHSWNVVVNDSIAIAIEELTQALGESQSSVRSGTKTFLDIW